MSVIYSDHVKRRMQERNVPKSLVQLVLKLPDQIFLDTVTGYYVHIKQVMFKGKLRYIAVSVDKSTIPTSVIISVHPVRERDVVSRTERKRWI